MPCPPSLEEREASRCSLHRQSAFKNASQLKKVQALLDHLVKAFPQHISSLTEIEAVMSMSAVPAIGNEPDWWNQPDLVDDFWAWSKQVKAEDQRLEFLQCIASTLMVNTWDDLLQANVSLKDLTTQYLEIEAHHRQHREADRQRVIYNLKSILSRSLSDALRSQAVQTELDRVESLTIDALMRNRSLLDIPQQF